MPIKLAFFLPNLNGGGAEKVFVTLANNLATQDYQVDFVLADAVGPNLTSLQNNINLFNLNKKHVIASYLLLGSYLKTNKPDVVFSALSNANLAIILSRLIFYPQCSVVITQHTNWSQVMANMPTIKERITYWISKILYPFATRIVAISDQIKNEIQQMPSVRRENIYKIYNPVVSDEIIVQSRQKLPHQWFQNKKVPVFLSVGRLSPEKDLETLILAFQSVHNKIPGKLIILGEGSERKALESLIQTLGLQEHVELPGFVSNPYAYMANSDVFVLSSLFEGLPTVLIEAMACGTTVVSTNCVSGPSEILQDGAFGSLVPIHDPAALANAMLYAAQHPANPKSLQARSEEFSVKKAVFEYKKLIDELISTR